MTHPLRTEDEGITHLLDTADQLLTGSSPIDEKASRKLTLEMLRQLLRLQFKIQREIQDWQLDVKTRRSEVNTRLDAIEKDIAELKRFPTLMWLLHNRTKPTVVVIVVVIVLVIVLFLTYQQWLLNRLGLPPLSFPAP